MNVLNSNNNNAWNSFKPTKRDINRTQKVASKSDILAGILTFILIPFGLNYLNTGINTFKILGYFFVACVIICTGVESEENADALVNLLSTATKGVIAAEQIVAVNKARQRSFVS